MITGWAAGRSGFGPLWIFFTAMSRRILKTHLPLQWVLPAAVMPIQAVFLFILPSQHCQHYDLKSVQYEKFSQEYASKV
jgi:hypothetical protein